VPVTVTATGGAALHVVLTTRAQGRFSENAIPLLAGSREVVFVPVVPAGYGAPPIDAELLAASLRVDHVGMYL
jgi:hypothetical protein